MRKEINFIAANSFSIVAGTYLDGICQYDHNCQYIQATYGPYILQFYRHAGTHTHRVYILRSSRCVCAYTHPVSIFQKLYTVYPSIQF